MKKSVWCLIIGTVFFLSWVGANNTYSLRDACGDLTYYAQHPLCVTETVAIISRSPEEIWSGWAWKVQAGTFYVSHAVPTLAFSVLWAVMLVFGVCSLLSCFVRKE